MAESLEKNYLIIKNKNADLEKLIEKLSNIKNIIKEKAKIREKNREKEKI